MSPPDKEMIIDAYRELQQQGQIGPLGLRLLADLVAQEAPRFPVLLDNRAAFSDDQMWEWTQSFYEAKGATVVAGVLAQTADVDSMTRYLRRCVRNFLIEQARKTPAGAIRRKVEDLLREHQEFIRVPDGVAGAGRWQLAGAWWSPFGGDTRPLVTAAWAVPDIQAVRWSGRRRAPLASDESLVKILRAVLDAANGSMDEAELTWVLRQRFPVAAEPADAILDEELFERVAAPLEDRADIVVEVSDQAREIYEQLSPSQRALLPHLDKPMADRAQILGLGRSQAYVASGNLTSLLEVLVPDDALRAEVLAEVWRLCITNP